MFLPLRTCGRNQWYNALEILHDSNYNVDHPFLAYTRPRKVDSNPCESCWYLYNFDTELVSPVEASG